MRGLHTITRAASPNSSDWCKWIENDDGNHTIDIDADGVFTQQNRVLIDLSQALSQVLGRQMSMFSTYEVEYIRIELLNEDDANDNDSGACFSGTGYYWAPSKHRIDAMQLMRQVEAVDESGEIDGDSFLLSLDRDYKGMRFNWDGDGQVHHATQEDFASLAGTYWDLNELMQVYGTMQQQGNEYSNALWDTRTGVHNSFGFSVSYSNDLANTPEPAIHDPKSLPFELNHPISVLGGLIMLDFTHSSTDSPINVVDDDYLVQVTVGVKGWSDF